MSLAIKNLDTESWRVVPLDFAPRRAGAEPESAAEAEAGSRPAGSKIRDKIMNELNKTAIFVGIALVLGVVAFASAPRRAAPDLFFDVGEAFFPEFADPDAAASLEVMEFDEDTASATPFQVTNQGGLWTIPSHHDYQADGAERLSNIAADIISLVKEDFRSDNVADHEALGVIDPSDLTTSSLVAVAPG